MDPEVYKRMQEFLTFMTNLFPEQREKAYEVLIQQGLTKEEVQGLSELVFLHELMTNPYKYKKVCEFMAEAYWKEANAERKDHHDVHHHI